MRPERAAAAVRGSVVPHAGGLEPLTHPARESTQPTPVRWRRGQLEPLTILAEQTVVQTFTTAGSGSQRNSG